MLEFIMNFLRLILSILEVIIVIPLYTVERLASLVVPGEAGTVISVVLVGGLFLYLLLCSIMSAIRYNKKKKENVEKLFFIDKKLKKMNEKLLDTFKKSSLSNLSSNTFEILDDNQSFIYNDRLQLEKAEKNVKWLNNEDKLKYYENLIEKIDIKFRVNINDYNQYKDLINAMSKKCESTMHKYNSFIKQNTKTEYTIEKISLGNISQEKFNSDDISLYINNYIEIINNKVNEFKMYYSRRIYQITGDYRGCKVGMEGEKRVNEELSIYNNMINLANIRIEVQDTNGELQSIENDNILLTKNGIFVLEVKNLGEIGNYDIIIEPDGRWLRKDRKSGETNPMKNVSSQNNRHIAFLNKFLNEKMNKDFNDYIEVNGLIIIPNEKVGISNNSKNTYVYRPSEIYAHIKNEPIKFKKEELDLMKCILEEATLKPKAHTVDDYYNELENNLMRFNKFSEEVEYVLTKVDRIIDDIKNEISTM